MLCKMHEYKVMRETDIGCLHSCIHPSVLHSEVNPITLIFQWRKEDHTDKRTFSAIELVTVQAGLKMTPKSMYCPLHQLWIT